MANVKPGKGGTKPDSIRPDSAWKYDERERERCYVQGESDLLYGQVSGFREGITTTGARHKQTALGKKARNGLA